MCKKLIIFALLIAMSGCSKVEEEQPVLTFNSAEEHIRFIIEEYEFGEFESYILDFVNNEFVTNEFIIDSLADNYSKVLDIKNSDEDLYRVKVDNNEILDIYIRLSENRIEKIKVKDGEANEKS